MRGSHRLLITAAAAHHEPWGLEGGLALDQGSHPGFREKIPDSEHSGRGQEALVWAWELYQFDLFPSGHEEVFREPPDAKKPCGLVVGANVSTPTLPIVS